MCWNMLKWYGDSAFLVIHLGYGWDLRVGSVYIAAPVEALIRDYMAFASARGPRCLVLI